MRIPFLTFGAIASILTINSAFATSSTVTSKDYVDTQDALKQNKIPATGTNASTPGDTVVTYTQTGNGVIGERGIYAGDWYVDGVDEDKLVTTDVVVKTKNCVEQMIPEMWCEDYERDEVGRIIGDCILVGVNYAHLVPGQICDDDPFNGQTSCTTNADCGLGSTCCHHSCQRGEGECLGQGVQNGCGLQPFFIGKWPIAKYVEFGKKCVYNCPANLIQT